MKAIARTLTTVGVMSTLFLWGCAGTNLYSINMYYNADQADIPEYVKADARSTGVLISVAEFTDSRQTNDSLIVGRVVERNGMKTLVFPKNVPATRAVSNGVRQYLKKAGYNVSGRMEQWNLREHNMPMGDSKILIGGSIEELEISCRRGVPTNTYHTHMKLNIVIADMTRGRILYKTTVRSTASKEHVLFSENILGEQAEAILADAIEKLFADQNVARKLKEAMSR